MKLRHDRKTGAVLLAAAIAWAAVAATGQEPAADAPAVQNGSHDQLQNDPVLAKQLQSLIDKHKLPGMAAAVLHRGRLVAVGAAGVRKQGLPELVTVADKFHLGSNTKAMTATLIAMLVEEKKLDWDSAVGDVLPELKESIDEGYHGVTLHQLLTHRGSLPANSLIMMWRLPGADQRADLLRGALSNPPKFAPGSKFQYSNLGYVLAGLMAERAGGEPWERQMENRLLRPLGMTSAGFGPPGAKDKVEQPWGHQQVLFLGHRPLQHDNPPVLGPAGTLHCSPADWTKFAALHLGHPPDSGPLLSPKTLNFLHRPPPGQNYALGWGVARFDWNRGPALVHSGSNTMWFCTVLLAPKRDAAFFAATNAGGGSAEKACQQCVQMLSAELDRRLEAQ